MSALFALAQNTFRETARGQLLRVGSMLAVLLLLAAPFVGALGGGQQQRVMIDFGLALIQVSGFFLTLFCGSRLLFQELEQKTIYLLRVKPISPTVIMLAKFCGLGAVLFVVTLILSILFFLLVPFQWSLLLTIALLFLSFLLLLALLLFLSGFLSPLLATLCGLGIWLIGNITFTLQEFFQTSSHAFIRFCGKVLYQLWPNFANLDLKNYVLERIPYTPTEIWWNVFVALAFIALFLWDAISLFARREFD